MRRNVGFLIYGLICGLSLVLDDLKTGTIVCPFPMTQNLLAPHPYRLKLGADSDKRPQVLKFVQWLRAKASETEAQMMAAVNETVPAS